ncbi:alpha/beta hydrolase [Robertkochia solimangrovi]|uniref:alpha/beta hydrolase n=1 Tax=Robertkochia solimangrovi TaxID=2213046 RepID=UPI0011815D15|nr:alpha/beta hydrolase-fold protein [Robertkochia solimangrovi]TRZ41644.1 esterase [Robertkochia solimangrovi]
MEKIFYTIIILFTFNHIVGQSLDDSILLKSDALQEQREIKIFLPSSYENGSKTYPVLYVIDAQRYFLNGVVYQQNLAWQEITPEFIVVGINTDPIKRRNLFYKDSAKFVRFLEKELIPAIDAKYRTTNDRIYFGWEMAGGLGVQIIANKSDLFKGFLLSSPTHILKDRLKSVSEMLKNGTKQQLTVYSVLGSIENWATESMFSLDSIFQKYSTENINWKYNLSDNENHYTTPLTTINEGLKLFFSDYGPVRFYSIQEFKDFGGIEKLKQHYLNRAKRYQISNDIHDDTKHYLLLQAHKEDNFKLFDALIEEFDGKTFIKNYYRQPRWFKRFSNFYFDNNRLEDALVILNLGLDKFPDASMLYFAKAIYFKAIGNVQDSELWYEKTIQIAKTNNDPELEAYKTEWMKTTNANN